MKGIIVLQEAAAVWLSVPVFILTQPRDIAWRTDRAQATKRRAIYNPVVPEKEPKSTLRKAQDQFILEWGRMSSSWGINRTMAQIHALLFVTGEALEVNEIMDWLQISRGNASMNLRELMDWGVVRRFRQPGDRKDTYVSETDPYQMFVRIVKERKRREIDPTTDAIREVMAKLPETDRQEEVVDLRRRLQALLEIFDLVDVAYKQIFANDVSLDELKDLVKGATEDAAARI